MCAVAISIGMAKLGFPSFTKDSVSIFLPLSHTYLCAAYVCEGHPQTMLVRKYNLYDTVA